MVSEGSKGERGRRGRGGGGGREGEREGGEKGGRDGKDTKSIYLRSPILSESHNCKPCTMYPYMYIIIHVLLHNIVYMYTCTLIFNIHVHV